ncbi:VOC family protein [Aquirufa sp.]|jgi:PhnB protein|uniref:VOC family protein n=1 Tax=Aquirufa sp. TaxID=2676249 RepID=UPI0037C0D076
MARIRPHIHFNGNTEEAFEFYRSIFGGEFSRLMRFSELNSPEFSFPEEEQHKIMLVRLPIGTSCVLSGSDVANFLGVVNEEENRSKITVSADSKEEAEAIFLGLSTGGVVEMPMDKGPWRSNLGTLREKYGIEWMVEYVQ